MYFPFPAAKRTMHYHSSPKKPVPINVAAALTRVYNSSVTAAETKSHTKCSDSNYFVPRNVCSLRKG